MSFAINPSLNHIDVPEACVHELYRSSAAVLLQDARFRGHACEAYICIAKIDKDLKAYVALLETGMKTVFVYTSDYITSNPAEFPEVYKQAANFVGAMGFVMEPVNLSFSPAMREVIIKGFRVMRPPPPKKQPPRQLKSAPTSGPAAIDLKTSPPPTIVDATTSQGDASIELESLRRELASAKAAIAQLTREKVLLEQSAAKEISALKASCAQAIESKQRAAESFAAEAEKLRQEDASRASRTADDEKAALKAELLQVTAAAKSTESGLQEKIAALQQQVAQLVTDNLALEKRITTINTAAAEQLQLLADERETLLSRVAAGETAAIAAADKIATLALFETSWREGQQREEDLCRNLDLLKSQIDLQAAELEQYQERERREEAMQLEIHELQAELAAVRVKAEEADSTPDLLESILAELKTLQEAKTAVETEYVRFANECSRKEAELLDTLAASEMEVERLTRENEIRAQLAAREQAALQEELRQLVEGGAGASRLTEESTADVQPTPATVADTAHRGGADLAVPPLPPPALPAAVPSPAPQLAADEPDRPIAVDREIIAGLMNDFGSFRGSSGYSSTEFKIDPALITVAYNRPEEIVVLLYSSNTVQAVPDGSNIQRCKGYVIATREEDTYKVYVAWYLTESRKVVVCTPPQQPADRDECIQILLDAVTYFEIVGFMMELVELGESAASYIRELAKIPVVSRTPAT